MEEEISKDIVNYVVEHNMDRVLKFSEWFCFIMGGILIIKLEILIALFWLGLGIVLAFIIRDAMKLRKKLKGGDENGV